MKRIFLFSLFICLFGTEAFAQEATQTKAWKIVYTQTIKPLPEASKTQKRKAKKFNKKHHAVRIIHIISDDLYRTKTKKGDPLNILLNRRDSVVYLYEDNGKKAYETSYNTYAKHVANALSHFPLTNIQEFSNNEKTMLNTKVEKVTYQTSKPGLGGEKISHTNWVAVNLPNWFMNLSRFHGLPGVPIKAVKKYNNLKEIYKAVSITPVSLDESDYRPPKGYRIIKR